LGNEKKMVHVFIFLVCPAEEVALCWAMKKFFNGTCIYFPCLSRRRSGIVLDNEKVFLMGNGDVLIFPCRLTK